MSEAQRLPVGSLKCIICVSLRPQIAAVMHEALRERVGAEEMRALGESVLLVHAEPSAEEIRDWLRVALRSDETLLVLEFERWSSWGRAIDAAWLGRRGH